MNIKYTLLFILFFICLSNFAQNKVDDVTGVWLTAGDDPARIQIYRSGDQFFGKIIWLKIPLKNGVERRDTKNPKNENHSNQIIGLLLLKNFKFDNKDEWKGGEIYDPESGKTYRSYLYFKDKNTLKVRGFIGISLIGRTETWTRVK